MRLGVLNFRIFQPQNVSEAVVQKVFLKISQNCTRVSFLIKLHALACNFIKKRDSDTGVSCEFCEIFKNNFFTDHLWTTAPETGT